MRERGNAAWRSLGDDEPEDALGGKIDGDQVIERTGFYSREHVATVAQKCRPLTPRETMRLALKHSRRHGFGRRGMPREIVRAMYMDYLREGSVSKVGKLWGRSRQSVWAVFHRAGVELHQRNLHARIIWGGRAWTPNKGCYRPTTGDRTEKLHHAMWRATGREIPPGHQVTFINGDSMDLRQENLTCLPITEVTLMHYRRHYPARAEMTREQREEMWKFHKRLYMRAKRDRVKEAMTGQVQSSCLREGGQAA